MIKIRLTLKDGRMFYASEGWPYSHKAIELKHSFDDGLSYRTILEFKVAWDIFNGYEYKGITLDNPHYDIFNTKKSSNAWQKRLFFRKEDFIKFEAIDCMTLKKKSFDVYKKETLSQSKVLMFPPDQFNMLKKHPYTCCHWTYIGKEWKAFPKEEDYKLIDSIHYYRRGFSGLIWDAFCYRNMTEIDIRNSFYNSRKELLFNPIIQKMYLRDDIDSCKNFIVKSITIL